MQLEKGALKLRNVQSLMVIRSERARILAPQKNSATLQSYIFVNFNKTSSNLAPLLILWRIFFAVLTGVFANWSQRKIEKP